MLVEVVAHWECCTQVRAILEQRWVAKDQDLVNMVSIWSLLAWPDMAPLHFDPLLFPYLPQLIFCVHKDCNFFFT